MNVFDRGALAPGVTVDTANYRILSFDAGLKYKGIFLQTEIYNRWLDNFKADGPLPVASIHDTGFYVQGAFFPVPKKLEAVRRHLADLRRQGCGLQQQLRVRGGGELLSVRLAQLSAEHPVMDVNRSPVSSAFGYYVGGLKGNSFAVGFSVFF